MDSVVIIGGGVVGLTCAYYLQQEQITTAIYDRGQLGRESSWAGAGLLAPLYPTRYPAPIVELSRASISEYSTIAQQLKDSTNIDPELLQTGAIILDPETKSRESPRKLREVMKDGFEYLNPDALLEIEPNLVRRTQEVLFLPKVSQIRNPRLMAALRQAITPMATIHEGSEVSGFEINRGKLQGIKINGRTVRTERCIVTAGAWSGDLLARVNLPLPVQPVRGQMLLIAARPGHVRHVLVDDYRYLVPRMDGRILVGSTLENVGYDKSTTAEARNDLLRVATDLVPTLARYPIEAHWSGLRPGSPDSLPFIGEHPAVRGLFVCTGHYRNGLALAPATARMVVDLLLERTPVLDPAPFRLDRTIGTQVTN